ncbi:MAG: triose-phosphate isomerase [Firmicutes bacterium]|nr:triose-phosphate isomerase [Bacillota bacterium]
MENKLIVANHKMNMTASEINEFLKELGKINNKNVVICPTSIYIPYFLKKKFQVGIQNTFIHEKGAYTGEVSPMQAKSLGVNYTILGHSERRMYLEESDTFINKKVLEALNYDLKPIICIGETLEERNMLKTDKILKRQVINALRDVAKIEEVIIAYEPIWAIGTGVVPTNKEIKATISYIKTIINGLYPNNKVKVLYGGSVTEKNIKELNKIKEVDGYLVGGASLKPQAFLNIIEVVDSQ